MCCQFVPEVEAVLHSLCNEGKFQDWPLDPEEESIVKSAFLACLNTGPNFDVFLQTELAKLDFDKNLVEEIICFTTHSWEMCCQETRLMLHRILVSRSTVVRNWSEI